MATTFTAPGVYIQEIPSGNRTITGVSTSLTAFVGPALRGPVVTPTRVNSWADFERTFGGLWAASTMSHAVRHYFLNGGAEALIIRVVNGSDTAGVGADRSTAALGIGLRLQASEDALALDSFDHLAATVANADTNAGTFDLSISAVDSADAPLVDADDDPFTVSLTALNVTADYVAAIESALTATLAPITLVAAASAARSSPPADGSYNSTDVAGGAVVSLTGQALTLNAASPGAWGENLRAQIGHVDAEADHFHLTVTEVDAAGATVAEEVHFNLTTDTLGARSVERVLAEQSQLVSFGSTAAAAGPLPGVEVVSFSGGGDGAAPRETQDIVGTEADRRGIYALLEADVFNLLCIPLDGWASTDQPARDLWDAASLFCEQQRAFLIVDPPSDWSTFAAAETGANAIPISRSSNAGMYFPSIQVPNPLTENRLGTFPPCGVIAGTMARTDGARGVWKAPAGIDVNLNGVPELSLRLTDPQSGVLNQLGLNCLRSFPVYGRVVWGARTLEGADVLASDWKYVPVRRLALYIEESLFRGTQWAVFEPNDEPLWSQLRLSIGSFMQGLFRQGAFQGATASQAYLVKCDAETTTPADQGRGVVNVTIGFAPLKPAEFVIIKLQQIAAQAE